MSRTKVLALAGVIAAFCVYLLPGGLAQPPVASAADCTVDKTGTLRIRIVDASTGSTLSVAGTEVLVKPDPRDFVLDDIVVDTDLQDANTSQDTDSKEGFIRIEDVCSTEGSESYRASVWSLPTGLEECSIGTSDSTELAPDTTELLTVEVDCTGVGPTPTFTVTPTSGPAATVQTTTSPLAVGCNGTSVISVQVRDAGGNSVQTGTAVTITTTIGGVSPSSGFVTGSNGSVFAFYTAPATTGGTATITATAGSASGTAMVSVSCGTTAGTSVAPPPTVGTSSGGVIRPPNTGDAGLASRHQDSAVLFGLSFLALSLAGLGLWMRFRLT